MTAPITIRVVLPACLALVAGLSGCGMTGAMSKNTFGLYVPDVIQGNFVSREQREYLRPGMTRAQVRDVLGTPLVASVFHADRWDYVFTIRRQGVPPQQFRLTAFFQGEQLQRVEGDDLPSETEFVRQLDPSGKPVRVPVLQATEEQLRRQPVRSEASASTPAPVAVPARSYPPLEAAPR